MSDLYAKAGVSIEAGQEAVALLKTAVARTHGPEVLAGVGAFGGLFELSKALEELARPTLVASTDGVGTKVKLAAEVGAHESIGHDIVNHCLNDILCAGEEVRPLIFLDYLASSKLDPARVARIVSGMAEACRAVGCALLGGETAEMPEVYDDGAFDVVGTIAGLVDADRLYPRPDLAAGDVLLGLPSSGPHTNGYTLIRTIFANTPLDTEVEEVGSLGEALLRPHRSYYATLNQLYEAGLPIKGLAHITGGGLVDNVPRALAGFAPLTAHIEPKSWPIPPLFGHIAAAGGVPEAEMYRVFNMGIGMVAVMERAAAETARDVLGEGWIIGEVVNA